MPSSVRSEPRALSGHRVFLTGGTGFLGRSLLDYFAESARVHGSDFELHVLSRTPEAFLERHPRCRTLPWLHLHQGSVTQPLPLRGRFSHVVHAAADTHARYAAADWMMQIVDGTRNALEFARRSGASRFLLLSSGAVYGAQPASLARVDEAFTGAPAPTLPSSAYGQAKRVAEQLCTAYRQEFGLETVVARCFAVVGEHMPLDGPYAIGNFIRDAMQGGSIRVAGDGTPLRSYLHARDAAHWFTTLLLAGQPGEAYNVGSDAGRSIREVAELVAACLSPASRVTVTSNAADGVRSVYVPSIAKAATLGLQVETALDEAIRLTADALRRSSWQGA